MKAPTPRRARRPATHEREALLQRARAVLEENWNGHITVASKALYPHQWSWDAAFIAIGRSWTEPDRAMQELELLFEAQWSNGMLPHIRFDPSVPPEGYFPGPDFWGSDRSPLAPTGVQTSGITQPPLHARAALEIYHHTPDPEAGRAFLRRLFPKLVAEHTYLANQRDPAGTGLAAIVHPWESGLDNSPLWDSELESFTIPPGGVPPYKRFDLLHANPADRPSNEAYDRYVYLAVHYRDSGYDDSRLLEASPFLIAPPLFNAVYVWSAHALVEIAGILGEDQAPLRVAARRIHEGIMAHLWDPDAKCFFAREPRTGRVIAKESIDSFTPLIDPQLPADVVDALAAGLTSPHFDPPADMEHFLIPSFDLEEADFNRRLYWRGPVWINTDWLVARGLAHHSHRALADEVEGSMVRLVERAGFREYFDPFTGEGYGSTDFSWTASLLTDVLRSQAASAR